MPVTVKWDDDAHTLLCFRIVGRWTWQEFNWAWLESAALTSSVSHRVNFILDVTEMISLPPDLLTRTLHFLRNQPRNAGISFVATTSGFMTLLLASLKQIAPRESGYLKSVPSIEAARHTLALMAS